MKSAPGARSFGVTVSQRTLLPGADVLVGEIRIQDRFAQLATAELETSGRPRSAATAP